MPSSRVIQVVRPLLVALMFACVAESIAQFIRAFVPGWNAAYVVAAMFLISLEAHYASRLAQMTHLSGRERWVFRLSEWTVILVALKLGSYLARGLGPLLEDLGRWESDPTEIFTPEFVIVVVLAVVTWQASGSVYHWLQDLTQPADGYFNPAASLGALQAIFFVGGVVVVLFAGLTQVGLQYALQMNRPPVGGVIVNVLVYFIVGLLFLSQARLELLHTRWQASGIEVASNIRTRWGLIALATLGGVALLALLLPTRYGLGVLETAGGVLGILTNIALFLGYLLNFIFFLIFGAFIALISLLLGRPSPAREAPSPPPMIPPAVPAVEGADWLSILRSLLFWAIAVGIVGYALAQFVGSRRDWWLALAQRWRLGWLVNFLALFWGRVQTAASQVRRAARDQWTRLTHPTVRPPRRWLRLGALSPRELVQYFYLSTAQRAAQAGMPRGTTETAREYAQRLRGELPNAETDVETLTDAFESARYSAHAVSRDDTVPPRRAWEHLRRLLRGRFREPPPQP